MNAPDFLAARLRPPVPAQQIIPQKHLIRGVLNATCVDAQTCNMWYTDAQIGHMCYNGNYKMKQTRERKQITKSYLSSDCSL